MSANGKLRVYNSTFDCMNKTHIDEGFYSLYKGSTFAITGAVAKACLTLPIYDLFKRK